MRTARVVREGEALIYALLVPTYHHLLPTTYYLLLTARVVREGEALILKGAAPHTLTESAHAVLHVTALRDEAMAMRPGLMVSEYVGKCARPRSTLASEQMSKLVSCYGLRHEARYDPLQLRTHKVQPDAVCVGAALPRAKLRKVGRRLRSAIASSVIASRVTIVVSVVIASRSWREALGWSSIMPTMPLLQWHHFLLYSLHYTLGTRPP